MRYAALLFGAGFAAAAVAVALGGFTGLDQWSVDHLMPWVSPTTHAQTVTLVLLPFNGRTPAAEIPLALWTYPASVPVSAAIVAACSLLLWRRGSRGAAAIWAAAWVAGNAVEVLGKSTIHRPTLDTVSHGARVAVTGFESSFPSGHTLRAVLVAVLVGLLWPRARLAVAAWAAATLAFLVVTNAHTPSDVLGGALLAGALATATLALVRSARPVRSEPALRPAAGPAPAD